MAKQKFYRGHRVHICKDLGSSMRHFESDVDAIIEGSYSDIYGYGGANSNHEYCVLILGKRPYRVSWYEEWQLSLIDKDRDKGEKLLQKYKRGA